MVPPARHPATRACQSLWFRPQMSVVLYCCCPLRSSLLLTRILASADRRPVDPPPVVELRIYEGHTWQEAEQKDITFLYNANFFLYATLEHARVIAHGRVQTPAANQPPVLTGMPVSGMAYLDRPAEAGYFLFPDLSVRHEGRYRLTFNLYEETKEDKDKDAETPDSQTTSGFSNATGGSFDFRMEVKSRDFTVFSAKKFPGLHESTLLSRTVAEQGCRVRIRRDVRMRRRDGKPGGDYDNNNNGEDEYTRRRRTETPEIQAANLRARSMSGSAERNSFPAEPQRRPSGADYPPPFPSQPGSAGGHLQFLGNSAQYPPQAQSHSRPPSMPPSPSYQTSHGQPQFPHQQPQQMHPQAHQQPAHQQTPTHQAPPQQTQQPIYPSPAPQQKYAQIERPQPPTYSHTNPSPRRETAPQEFREPAQPQYREPALREYRDTAAPSQIHRTPSKEYILPPPMLKAPPPMLKPMYSQPSPRDSTAVTLPPIDNLARYLGPNNAMPPLSSPTSDRMPTMQSMSANKNPGALPPPPAVAGSKRARDESSRYDDAQRYHNGARQDPQAFDENGEGILMYRRANGAEIEVNHDYI